MPDEQVQKPVARGDESFSLLAVANVALRRRWSIVAAGLAGMVLAFVVVRQAPRQYASSATFIPQGSQSGAASVLSLAASQFGIRVPTNDGSWDPIVYVELLQSRALLEPLARDTVIVTEQGGTPVAVMDLLKIEGPTPALRLERTIRRLRHQVVVASEDPRLRAVQVSVTTQWPSVSLAFAERLIDAINDFNLRVRNTQAAAERRFVERQALDAELALRIAEDSLEQFLQTNRIVGTPSLRFEQDRLEREVARRQQVWTSLLQSLEEARLREVRDTPVITVIETPTLAVLPQARRTALKMILGGMVAGLLALGVALARRILAGVREAPDPDAQEFVYLVRQVTPRFLKRPPAS